MTEKKEECEEEKPGKGKVYGSIKERGLGELSVEEVRSMDGGREVAER
jgi:hypothetical protein